MCASQRYTPYILLTKFIHKLPDTILNVLDFLIFFFKLFYLSRINKQCVLSFIIKFDIFHTNQKPY